MVMTSPKAPLSARDLLSVLQAYPECSSTLDLGENPILTTIAPVETATAGSLTFVERGKPLALLETTQASAVLLPQDAAMQQIARDRGLAWIASPQPKLLFARAVPLFYQPQRPPLGIHPTAIVDPTAQVGERVSIGAYVVIGPEAVLEDEVCLHPHVVIYGGARVGQGSVIHAQAVIHERAVLGRGCVIHSGAVIGSEGFGFVPSAQGWVKLDQVGSTVLEDQVEVGCNSAIDRPAMGETRVGENTKIDNLVQIAHNCQLGRNCLMAGQSGMAGSVTLEDNVILAGQAGIANQIQVGKGAILSAQAGVIQDVAPGQVLSGHPAYPHRQWLKTATVSPHLPEMQRSLRALQQQVAALEAQIAALHTASQE
ncbi:MAG: UDP-3-O-(3-hydroxymyristoyl)glucosamine N-acyltransferase [Prochlorotrichaceae cyanobacterium]